MNKWIKGIGTIVIGAAIISQPITSYAAIKAKVVEKNEMVISLDQAIEKALTDNGNLIILDYKYNMQTYSEKEAKANVGDVEGTMNQAISQPTVTLPSIDCTGLTGTELNNCTNQNIINEAIQKMVGTKQSTGQLEKQKRQLEVMVKQVQTQLNLTTIEKEETKKQIKLGITNQFINLLSLKNQIKQLELSIETKKLDYENAKLLVNQGLNSNHSLNTINKEYEDLLFNLETLKKSYNFGMKEFCFDIGIGYSESLVLQNIALTNADIKELQLPKTFDDILAKSYSLKKIDEQIDVARVEQQKTLSNYTQEEKILNIKMLEKQKEELKESIKKVARNEYENINKLVNNYNEALKNVEFLKADLNIKKLQYENGLLSNKQFEQSKKLLEQKQIEVEKIKYDYFISKEKINLLNEGYMAN